MAPLTVADTIREITRRHLEENNGLLLGQSISAVGWVNNTVPDCRNIVELPMSDVAGPGFAVGAALVGRRPIFVIRFQDFLVLNGSPFIFYAAKVKELHNCTAPVFIRGIASDGLGPVHSGVLHSLFMHFPGFRVCSPMTPMEYLKIWDNFMDHDDPMMVSEHRLSFQNSEEMPDLLQDNAEITLFPISATRFETLKALEILTKEGIKCNVCHLLWLKPFVCEERLLAPLKQTGKGLVIDPGHEIAGASQSIAYELSRASKCHVEAMGLLDHTKCLCPPLRNEIPNAATIVARIKTIIQSG